MSTSTDIRGFKWRTAPTSEEGTATVYVDSFIGSDLYGDGTRANPYQSIGKAWSAITKPSVIVCRGVFSEDVDDTATQNPSLARTIKGDYWGAACFEGNDLYAITGFKISNFILRNTRTPSSASYDNGVGVSGVNLDYFGGTLFQNTLLSRCYPYGGLIGSVNGISEISRIVFAKPRNPSERKILISCSGSSNKSFTQNTLYDCEIANRKKCNYARDGVYRNTIFAKFAMIANEDLVHTFYNCLFTGDTQWYIVDGNNTQEIEITGETSNARRDSIIAALDAWYRSKDLIPSEQPHPSFINCIFSTQNSNEIFNNPEKDDFTLRVAEGFNNDAIGDFGTEKYCGALPPALNVPIMDNSEMKAGTWDERSKSGCLTIANNMICIDSEKSEKVGSIHSKIIRIDPVTTQLNGIFAVFHNRWKEYNVYANKHSIFKDYTNSPDGTSPDEYTSDRDLSEGLYMSTAEATYDGNSIGAGGIVRVTTGGTHFTSSVTGAKFIKIVEPNVTDCVFVRCRSRVYAHVKAAGDDEENPVTGSTTVLQQGATYFNDGNKDIRYRQRTIVPGESFVCIDQSEYFTCPTDPDYKIAIIFDDTRVPAASKWVPAQQFGEYFVAKEAGSMVEAFGIPKGSGNPYSYPDDGLYKSTADRIFVQFAIFVNKYEYNAD